MGLNVMDDVAKNPTRGLPNPFTASSSEIFQLDRTLSRRACGAQVPVYVPVSWPSQPPEFNTERVCGTRGNVLVLGTRTVVLMPAADRSIDKQRVRGSVRQKAGEWKLPKAGWS